MTIKVCSTHIYLFFLEGKKLSYIIQPPSEGFSTGCFPPVGFSAERPWNDVKNGQYFFLRNDKQRNKQTNMQNTLWILSFVNVKRWNRSSSCKLKKHKTSKHTCLNNCTAFKEILGTQEILTMNVQSFLGVKELIEGRIIYRQIRGNYHLSWKQPKIRENKLIRF